MAPMGLYLRALIWDAAWKEIARLIWESFDLKSELWKTLTTVASWQRLIAKANHRVNPTMCTIESLENNLFTFE